MKPFLMKMNGLLLLIDCLFLSSYCQNHDLLPIPSFVH